MEIFRTIYLYLLRISAQIQLLKLQPKHIIGITGSAGKTSCKEAVIAVLREKYRIKEGKAGLNSEFGLPMDILDLNFTYSSALDLFLKSLVVIPWKLLTDWKRFDVLVFEMGIDSPKAPGDMTTLLRIVKPDIGVLLNVLPVHTAYFQESGQESEAELVKRIADEKGKLIEALPERGWAILNSDDRNSLRFRDRTQAKVITFGGAKAAHVKGFIFETDKYVFNDDYMYTFAAAMAVGKALGIPGDEAKAYLKKNLVLPPGRMSRFDGINDSTIIDSSYNASKIPVITALKTLDEQFHKLSRDPKSGRKIAVLGDMRELGDLAQQEHEEVAREAVKRSQYIFTFGPLMEKYAVPEIRRIHGQKGMRLKEIKSFRKMEELILAVKGFVGKGDVVLVKGSQNTIFLERLVKSLLAYPEDEKRLCRRGEMWDRKRNLSD